MIYWLAVLLVVLGQFSEGFVTIAGAGSVSNSFATSQRSTGLIKNPSTSKISLEKTSVKVQLSNNEMGPSITSNKRRSSSRSSSTPFLNRQSKGPSVPINSLLNNAFDTLKRFPPRGGTSLEKHSTSLFASTSGEASGEVSGCPFTKFMTAFGAFWGSFGVIYILAKAIFRVLPIAVEPFAYQQEFSSLILSPLQWCAYAASCLVFAYAEGYKGFHKKFAPLVVKRSFTLVIGTKQGNNPLNYLLAPLYSMGLWGATSKRLIVSWGVTTGVALLVAIVKRLPPAPRCILDAGVVVGLSIGSASILYHFARSVLTGSLPNVDACLPIEKKA